MDKTIILGTSVVLTVCIFTVAAVHANPQGADVVHGQVDISSPSTNVLNITNSPGAIVNWQSFGIAPNEITQFIQQGSHSAILNRVIGQDPSQIMGQLISNGKVFLINPNGIVFGANSVVDTAGLIASSLNLSDQDFLNGNMQFDGNAQNGAIQSQGYIKAGLNGDVYLIAPNIENSGIIETQGGQIILAAGEKLTLASFETENIVFEVQSQENEVTNLGSITTHGGAASIFAGTITHSGSINADSVSVDSEGQIVLAATQNITVDETALITASGNNGGKIHIESELGDSVVKGAIEAKGNDGKGGSIHVLGERVGVFSDAIIDVSGTESGGEVLIGGDFQGKNLDIKNATQTAVGDDAVIKANAVDSGDGGKVIVWADDFTEFHGVIEATGGDNSGNGGFVEVSGKNNLNYQGEIDVTAKNGNGGSVLFDPKNIKIDIDVPTDTVSTNDGFAENATGTATFSPGAITALLGGGTDVTLQASNNIDINEAVTVTGANAVWTIEAGKSIAVNANVITNGGDFKAIANSSNIGVVAAQRDGGDGEFKLEAGDVINTGGGAVSIEVSNGSALEIGDIILENGADILGGSIDLNSQGNIDIQTSATVDSNGSNIVLISEGNVDLDSGATIDSGGGTIDITAKGTLSLKEISAAGATITSIGGTGGNINITADDLDVQTGSLITTPGTFSGNLTIMPFSTNKDIHLGTGGAGSPLEISAAELARMTAIDTLTIGRSTDTGTLTVATNLASGGLNASTLILKHQSIVTNNTNTIDFSAGGENLELIASALVDLNNAIDAGNVKIESPNATFAPVTTINIDSFTANGTVAPTSATFDGAGVTLFKSSTTLNTVSQTAGSINTSAGQAVTINGTYTWGGGAIDGTVTANATTIVGSTVTLNGTFNNNGTFSWVGGNFGGGGTFNNNAGASFTMLGNGSFDQGFNNAGTFSKTVGAGTSSFTSAFTNTGTVNANSGLLEFDGYTQTAGITRLNGGNIDDTGGTTNINGGTLSGIGSFTAGDLNINGATLAPGTSPGTLNIVGNLNLGSTSTTLIELGGTSQGSNYDFIDVTGDVALDGTLNVSMFGGFTGLVGNQFDIISSGTNNMTGAFANTILPASYSVSSGIVGAGSLFRLGLTSVPVVVTNNIVPTDEVLVLEENYDNFIFDDIIFSADETDEEYDDQVQICS